MSSYLIERLKTVRSSCLRLLLKKLLSDPGISPEVSKMLSELLSSRFSLDFGKEPARFARKFWQIAAKHAWRDAFIA